MWTSSINLAAAGAVKKKGAKLGPIVEKKILPVETDTEKLVNYVCGSNILVKGEDIKVSCFMSSLIIDKATMWWIKINNFS